MGGGVSGECAHGMRFAGAGGECADACGAGPGGGDGAVDAVGEPHEGVEGGHGVEESCGEGAVGRCGAAGEDGGAERAEVGEEFADVAEEPGVCEEWGGFGAFVFLGGFDGGEAFEGGGCGLEADEAHASFEAEAEEGGVVERRVVGFGGGGAGGAG